MDGHEAVLETPEAITAAGLAGDPIALEVLDQFSIWLGRVAGNNVLTTGGRGGVYIVGGVIPRFADDAHFPAPVWAARARDGVAHGRPDLAAALREVLGTNPPAPQGLA